MDGTRQRAAMTQTMRMRSGRYRLEAKAAAMG
jgi:hypothetical protein